jgi:hypothetical protein
LDNPLDKQQPESREAGAYALVAMARRQMKLPAEARAALARSQGILDIKMSKVGSGDLSSGWYDWLIASILFREASGLIEGSADTGTRTK